MPTTYVRLADTVYEAQQTAGGQAGDWIFFGGPKAARGLGI